jgi:hypothetical protein
MSFDYYQILQVNPAATQAEIKTAYRRLAKLFHPDKNPTAGEKFRLIKEAYETLIDETLRRKYDLKRNYTISVAQAKKPEPVKKQKTYTFTESELKHRNYYQENYKIKPKASGYTDPGSIKTKTDYKELTYLLISIPAAVALLLLLINLYQKPKEKMQQENKAVVIESEVKTAESPYKAYLGKNAFDTLSRPCIKINNPSDNDAIVFLRNDKAKVVQHYFIEHNYRLFMEGIPKGAYRLYYYTGKSFTNKQYLLKTLIGNYSHAVGADSFPEKIKIKTSKQDTFLFSIPKENTGHIDTLLLKRLFDIN